MHIGAGTSAEAAIKVAFDFGKMLRAGDADDGDYARQRLVWVDQRYATHAFLPYIVVGFEAGYLGKPLPWVRQIDAAQIAAAAAAEPRPEGSPPP